LEFQQQERLIEINAYKKARDAGKLDPDEYLQLALKTVGVNIPIGYLKPPTLEELMRAKFDAILAGDTKTEQRLTQEQEALFRQVSPDIATAYRKADRLSGLETRRKRRRRPEEPGTFAEKIMAAKNAKINVPALRGFAHPKMLTERKEEKPIYQINRATGQTRVSYDGGKTWQVTG